MSDTQVLGVIGPTAVGKSAVADLVAQELGGEVVSIDSMQVYRGMDVGTAKTPAPERAVPYHMVDVAEVNQAYSVACFQRDARACVDALAQSGRPAVLCGGTGLYLDAVIDEMSFPVGETGGATRSPYEELARRDGPQALHDVLTQRDPASAALIHPHNVRRVVRALEMLDEGRPYSAQHEGLRRHEPHYQARLWALDLPRDELYARIDARADAMFARGLVDEVRRLERRGLRSSTTASQAIGYKEVLAALDGTLSMDEARERIKRNTRHYAKRQLSWIRRDGRARWLDLSELSADEAARIICDDWRRS